jgi:hypothetical protein
MFWPDLNCTYLRMKQHTRGYLHIRVLEQTLSRSLQEHVIKHNCAFHCFKITLLRLFSAPPSSRRVYNVSIMARCRKFQFMLVLTDSPFFTVTDSLQRWNPATQQRNYSQGKYLNLIHKSYPEQCTNRGYRRKQSNGASTCVQFNISSNIQIIK